MKKAYLFLFIFAFAIYSCSGVGFPEPDEKESEQVVEEENLEEPVDTDLDGIADSEDNCPEIANQDQLDLDEDGLGDLCDACPDDSTNTCNDCIDADGDGFLDATCGGDDCDDGNVEIYPGHSEVCDGVDNNCDGKTDENLGTTTCGLGVCEHTINNCENGVPQTCDPFEGASEEICDGLDNNCDGEKDNISPIPTTCGIGDCASTGEKTCVEGDWIDTCVEGDSYPETCDGLDNDCDGEIPANEKDDDGDGFMICEGDCDDTDADINPDAAEVCDGIDNDCDDLTDEEVKITFYHDQDSDSFGDPNQTQEACSAPNGYVANNTDCAPSDNTKWQYLTGYPDSDGDGFGAGSSEDVCSGTDLPSGYSTNNTDNCPVIANADQTDQDLDDIGDVCDNCPTLANTNQTNNDLDSLGDECDEDDDNDGVLDGVDNGMDNCQIIYNPNQSDDNGNSIGDICDFTEPDITITDISELQEAIDSIQDDQYIKILIPAGTYQLTQTINITDKNVAIMPEEGAEVIFESDEIITPILNITTPDENLDNTVVIKGIKFDGKGHSRGMLIEAGEADDTSIDKITIDNVTITNGKSNKGAGIYAAIDNSSILAIANSHFESNFTWGQYDKGGGVYLDTAGNSTIANSTFIDNSSDNGGGATINSHDISTIIIINSIFSNNWGGGLCLRSYDSSRIFILESTFSNNSADYAGGIDAYSLRFSAISIINSVFFNNSNSAGPGGGMRAYAYYRSIISIINNTFSDNSAISNGGGVYAVFQDDGYSHIKLINNIFKNTSNGGGIYLDIDGAGFIKYEYNLFFENYDDGEVCHVKENEDCITEFDDTDTNFIADPMLDGDLYPQVGPPTSPAINNGTTDEQELHYLFSITNHFYLFEEIRDFLLIDKDGNPRPVDAFDIGAYEVQ